MKSKKNPKKSPPEFNKEYLSQFKTLGDLSTHFTSMYQAAVNEMLQGELEAHLGYSAYERKQENSNKNFRNGSYPKMVKTDQGDIQLSVPRDREGSFHPQIVKKGDRVVENIEETVIRLYSKGLSIRDVEDEIQNLYGVELSDSSISRITNKVLTVVDEWQERPLASTYLVVWMDGIRFKVRQDRQLITKTIYIAIGLNEEGYKEVLGLWINETESASYWMHVLNEIKERGVKDIFITATDNLSGFTEAIAAVFPHSVSQLCVVHQIRNSLLKVSYKDKRTFAARLKSVYQAVNRQTAEACLDELEKDWGKSYPYIIKSWRTHWDHLSTFYDFPQEIRKLIYTTNVIENLNKQVRKRTKISEQFPNDDAALKAAYLAIVQLERKWTQPIANWPIILAQFTILYPSRLKIKI